MFKKYFGPSTLVTAAFIGPGTLTVCTLAGVQAGYGLLWALLFSVIATIILQEMAARLGLISQQGLGEALRAQLKTPILRITGILLVVSAIIIGNAAYEGGNISGAMLGLNAITGELHLNISNLYIHFWPLFIGMVAFFLLFTGKYKLIERVLIALVLLMSMVFLVTAIVVRPSLGAIAQGLFSPSMPAGDLLLVIALIGTTVVPYNLFLHASSVQQKWNDPEDLPGLRKENAVAIILGGIISMCIVITSAATMYGKSGEVSNAAQMAIQLEPLMGSWAKYFLATGLFAAGISSAITAPLAAAYAAKGIFGWQGGLKQGKFRAVWMFILILGTLLAALSVNPVELIKFAQMANGVLLPIIALFLLYVMNKAEVLGTYKNRWWQNLLGLVVIGVAVAISLKSLGIIG